MRRFTSARCLKIVDKTKLWRDVISAMWRRRYFGRRSRVSEWYHSEFREALLERKQLGRDLRLVASEPNGSDFNAPNRLTASGFRFSLNAW